MGWEGGDGCGGGGSSSQSFYGHASWYGPSMYSRRRVTRQRCTRSGKPLMLRPEVEALGLGEDGRRGDEAEGVDAEAGGGCRSGVMGEDKDWGE